MITIFGIEKFFVTALYKIIGLHSSFSFACAYCQIGNQ